MAPQQIGILYPGEMGISIAASAQNSGHTVYWASAGRSAATQRRAAKFELRDAQTLAQLCAECSIIVSVCPPDAAETVAGQVIAQGYQGLYLDANAIAPQRAERIGQTMAAAGVSFVDGGIIGGPAWQPGTTWLYLSGPQAETAAACFSAGPLATQVIGETIGKASAIKMCYAAYTKGSTALLAAVVATADQLDVGEELYQQWAREEADAAKRNVQRVRGVTAKAWRFAGEMEEIAATFRASGLPDGFHLAAADLYRRIAHFKDAATTPAIEVVLAALQHAHAPENDATKTEDG